MHACALCKVLTWATSPASISTSIETSGTDGERSAVTAPSFPLLSLLGMIRTPETIRGDSPALLHLHRCDASGLDTTTTEPREKSARGWPHLPMDGLGIAK